MLSHAFEGMDGHPIDHVKAATWIRRAMAHGTSDDGHPDPTGAALSSNSFAGGEAMLFTLGRKLYLRAFEDMVGGGLSDGEGGWSERMQLAADCGNASAAGLVAEGLASVGQEYTGVAS